MELHNDNKNVFISYSSQNAEMALMVCDYLERNEISCWMAPRNINPGANYATQIVHAIRNCAALVLIASESTNASGHVSNEISLAFDNKKLIVPFKIEKFTFSDEYIYFLGRKHWIDAYQNVESGLNQLKGTLCENLKLPNCKNETQVISAPIIPHQKTTECDKNISKEAVVEYVLKKAKKYCRNSLNIFTSQFKFADLKDRAAHFLNQSFAVLKHKKEIAVDSVIDYLVEEIIDDEEAEVIKVTGAPGNAKSVLLRTAFYEVLTQFKNNNTECLPFYISLNFYAKSYNNASVSAEQVKTDMYNDMAEFMQYVEIYEGVIPVLFVDGVREHYTGNISLDNVLMEIVDSLNIHKRVIAIDTDVIKNRSRLKRVIPLVADRVSACFEARAVDFSDQKKSKEYIKTFLTLNDFDVQAEKVYETIKRLKYQEIDAFTVLSISEEILNSGDGIDNISELYESWALTEFRGNEATLDLVSESAFNYLFKNDFKLEEVPFNHPLWRLVHKHRSFLDMLITRHIIGEIGKYEENKEFDYSVLSIMLTASSDRFVPDYFEDNYSLQEKVLHLATDQFDQLNPVQQSSVVFWLAKLTYSNLIADAKDFLYPRFDEMKPIVKKCDNTTQENYDNQFVFRAICFALAMFGETQVLDDYICILITNDSAHAINRGAIVEYYSGLHQMAANESYYLDTDIKFGANAINSLIHKISKNLKPGGKRYPELDLVTLASLIQMRIQTNRNHRDQTLKAWVNEYISLLNKYKMRPQHIKSEKIEFYFDSMYEDFQMFLDVDGDFDISQIMYNTLKNLKDVKRRQWTEKDIYDPESVSEHLYNSWMLAMLFLPLETNDEEYSKKEILDMLLIHDIAEAKLGDIVLDLSEPSRELREQNAVMRKMLVKGSYPNIANLTYYYNVWTGYFNGLNINAKIARDINLIQTVYTFCEYCIKYPDKYNNKDIQRWTNEKELLGTEIGFSIYEKLVENNSDFDAIFRKGEVKSATAQLDVKSSAGDHKNDLSNWGSKLHAEESKNEYRVLNYTELQTVNSDIDNIKTEISNIVSDVLSKESRADLDNNLRMLENISENWRVILDINDTLVGYWVFVALPDDLYTEAKLGKLEEKRITLDTIEFIDFPGTYNGYMLMAGTKPEARTATLVQMLYESLARHIEDLAQKGIFFKEILAVAESASGKSSIRKMGLLEKCDHINGGKVYYVDMTQVASNRYFSSFEVLKSLYSDYFGNAE